MSRTNRRQFIAGSLAVTATTAACGNGTRTNKGEIIDARVRNALNFMYTEIPGTQELRDKSSGMLVMPRITKAGFGIGGAYGEGALLVDGVTVDYYSTAQASFGLQIGAQQFAHTLFFMTPAALADFRGSDGWAVGGDVEYAVPDQGGNIGVETTTSLSPVIAVVYGQSGLIIGATLKGNKYTRIIR
ncbi:twin-arginine translocation pathway signal [Maritimibacter sp. 55A14]|uniref:lipid-binding SYLF domain-containing protein n=1 Tax=Maritimibacter sp. 55A14 TaxID=2174844 RepID=UPI000D61A9C1|nr:YSC84-related protein [Maritimibacter sp. 55A14]PWE33158.1 twin-arginine translocation pathway signal [Maritimibacter sp. 55A14]